MLGQRSKTVVDRMLVVHGFAINGKDEAHYIPCPTIQVSVAQPTQQFCGQRQHSAQSCSSAGSAIDTDQFSLMVMWLMPS